MGKKSEYTIAVLLFNFFPGEQEKNGTTTTT